MVGGKTGVRRCVDEEGERVLRDEFRMRLATTYKTFT